MSARQNGSRNFDSAERDVTETELAVLELLWQHPRSTIRDITDRLYPRGGQAHYATVQKLIERLEAKGFVKRDASAFAHRFDAAIGRDAFIGGRLRAMARQLCDGSLAPLLTSLVTSRSLTKDETSHLRELIEKLDSSERRRK